MATLERIGSEPSSFVLSEYGPIKEALRIVLTDYVASEDHRLNNIISMACVSKEFLELCLNSLIKFRILNTFARVCCIPPDTLNSITPSKQEIVSLPSQQILAIDEIGRHYIHEKKGHLRHNLVIMHPRTMKFIVLDLVTATKFAQKGVGHDTENGQAIVSCYPLDNRFIVVTLSGYSVWVYDDKGQPVCEGFHSPFAKYQHVGFYVHEDDTAIWYSGYQNGKLILLGTHDPCIVDVQNENPTFATLQLAQLPKLPDVNDLVHYLKNVGGYPHLHFNIEAKAYIQGVQIDQIPSPESSSGLMWQMSCVGDPLVFEGHVYGDTMPQGSPKWGLHCEYRLNSSQPPLMYVIHEGKLWMGKECGLVMPIGTNERCLIFEDFLFLSYSNGDFCLIYLPTKCSLKECTALQTYLQNKDASLYWLRMRYDEELGDCFDLFYQIVKSSICKDTAELYLVTIPWRDIA